MSDHDNMPLGSDQRRVGAGIALGLVSLAGGLWWLAGTLPAAGGPLASAAGLRYLAACLLFAATPVLLMVVAIATNRFSGAAINPLRGAETPGMAIDVRVLDNTVQQTLLFTAALSALASTLPAASLRWAGAAACCFVAARLAFWVGYRMDPLLRAPGMAATLYLNLGLWLAAGWRLAAA